jgi:hypothetical protein
MAGMNNVTIENCRFVLRNFSGKEGKYNPPGARNFGIVLTDELATQMADDGWNIKYFKPRDEEERGQPFIKVAVAFENKPPKILMVTSRGKTYLDEDTVHELDHVDIEIADVTLHPYEHSFNGGGVKAYAKTIVVKVVEDYLEMKWDAIIEGMKKEQKAIGSGDPDTDYLDAEFYEPREIGA